MSNLKGVITDASEEFNKLPNKDLISGIKKATKIRDNARERISAKQAETEGLSFSGSTTKIPTADEIKQEISRSYGKSDYERKDTEEGR